MKTSDAEGNVLDYLVAVAERRTIKRDPMGFKKDTPTSPQAGYWIWEETPSGKGGIIIAKSVYMLIGHEYSPSTDPAQAYPIIDREGIAIRPEAEAVGGWYAVCGVKGSDVFKSCSGWDGGGPTPLIAAMRCYVASKLGDVVEVPDELLQGK